MQKSYTTALSDAFVLIRRYFWFLMRMTYQIMQSKEARLLNYFVFVLKNVVFNRYLKI